MKVLRQLFIVLIVLSMSACGSGNEQEKARPKMKEATTAAAVKATSKKKTVVFFGDSLTAGYGIDEKDAFPALTQKRIDDAGLGYTVVNAGISGETTAAGLRRIDWVLKQAVDVFILELGGNDALRGVDPEETYRNLSGIVASVQEKYPKAKILLAGMEAPPNLGNDYTVSFRNAFKRVSEEKKITLMPFLLDGVGGVAELNQDDRIHPTAKGHAIVAENLWKWVKAML